MSLCKMALGKVELHIAATDEEEADCREDDIADASLPGVVAKQVRLRDLIGGLSVWWKAP